VLNNYTAPYPVGQDQRDVRLVAIAALPNVFDPAHEGVWFDGTFTVVNYGSDLHTLSAPQLTAWQAAVAATTPQTVVHRAEVLAAALAGAPTILRNQVTAAQPFVPNGVTAGNAVNVLQTVVNDLVVFAARLADLLESLGVPT
jgi:hypothetical protein